MAVREWFRLYEGNVVPLERALAAFDMFVLHERGGDFEDVCTEDEKPAIAAKNYRWPLGLTILHSKSAAKSQILRTYHHKKRL